MKVLSLFFFCLGITISFFYNKLSAAEAKDILLNQAYATTRLNEIERGECEKFNNLSSAKQNFYRNYFKELAENGSFSSSSSHNHKYDFASENLSTGHNQKKAEKSFSNWFRFFKKKS